VRRDEAAAELREKEEQRRIDEGDAELRLRVLRGVRDGTHTESQLADVEEKHDEAQRPNKKRRLDGEDTTERGGLLSTSSRQKDISLTDKNGHINLFPGSETCKAKGNVELATESKKRQQDFEDQYTMRFSNATGRNAGPSKPWYNEPARNDSSIAAVPKNVWGNEDPRRREREKKRTDANDPLAMIKKGVKQLREAEKHREEWRAQRERDLNEVEELAKKHKRRRKRRQSDEDSLEGFNLDGDQEKDDNQSERRNRKASSDRHRRRYGDGSGSQRHDGGRR
jgi:hypothetical protein